MCIVSLVFVEGLKSAVCVGSYCFMPVAIPRWYGRIVVVCFMKYSRWLSRYEFDQKTDERGALFVETVFAIVAFVHLFQPDGLPLLSGISNFFGFALTVTRNCAFVTLQPGKIFPGERMKCIPLNSW